MKFRIVDKRINDFLDYERIYRNSEKNKTYKLEKDGFTYKVKITPMSPEEYIEKCAKLFGMSKDRLIESRNDDSLKRLRTNINSSNYGIIYIDTFNKMQDGLHRAIILAEKKVPKINVLVIERISSNKDSIKAQKYYKYK